MNFLTRHKHEPRGSGATSIQELLDAQPSSDPSATALFEAEYRRRVFRWAADQVREAAHKWLNRKASVTGYLVNSLRDEEKHT